jgi:Uncharacterized protein conserved in bacteria (DUF2252)
MNINSATRQYETWLGEHLTLVPDNLTYKHTKMADAVFPFLRATFYRWAQEWPHVCATLAKAPAVLAVGDLHVENFGTWRDSEGRLIWGINDFDEAYRLPYTNDLVRLVTSVYLAIAAGHLSVKAREACNAILSGYTEGLQAGGRPFVLAEHHEPLRAVATSSLGDPAVFWKKLERLPTVNKAIPASASNALERSLPESGLHYRVAHRVAGLGSLGRQRWVAIAEWQGGAIAREAKALAPSAWVWANQHDDGSKSSYQAILDQAVRAPDPYLRVGKRWLVRRLAPDCSRIELSDLPKERDEIGLLHAMGWETANIHLGSTDGVKAIMRDLARRPAGWLGTAVEAMAHAVTEDWNMWRRNPVS